jgi:hypothetical protein
MKKRSKFAKAESKLSRQVQQIAERQARIPAPECLSEAITSYIEWHAFAYWVRLISETETSAGNQLSQALEKKCSGFLASVAEYTSKHPKEPEFLWLRLLSWIDEEVFAFSQTEGWSDALSYYAARDPRMDKLLAYWQECEVTWKDKTTCVLPDYEEWRSRAI